MKFRVGICGIGRIANDDHIPMLKRIHGFDLVAGYDITPARRLYCEYEFKVKAYSNLDEFLDQGMDLVVISSPSNTHKALAMKAIGKGINVVIEKPIALNSRDTKSIIEAAKAEGVLCTVYHNRRWDSDFITVRKVLDSGVIGVPLMIESRAVSFGSLIGYGVREFDTRWRYKKSHGGGVLLDFGTHLIDQLLQIVKDRPRSVWCGTKNALWSKEVEDYFKMIIRFDKGLVAQLETSQISRYSLPRWHITGTHGAILCDNWSFGPVRVKYNSVRRLEGKERLFQFCRPSKDIFYKNVLAALRKKEGLFVQPEEAYRVMVMIDAARESASKGREVKIIF